MRVGIITSSDKGYNSERVDISGPKVAEICKNNGYKVEEIVILPDEITQLSKKMIEFCDIKNYDLILTTGGTGFSVRDITPEATKMVIEREVPGIAEAMRFYSLQLTKRAMLSRSIAGIRGQSLIINLPGSPKAATENLCFIINEIKHGIEILKGSASECGT